MLNNILTNNKLVVAIVKKGTARKTVDASRKTGAEGGTIILAQGGGFRERTTFLGISRFPEKEVILTIIGEEKWREVWQTVCDFCTLEKKKRGIAFTIDLRAVSGVCHLCDMTKSVDESEEKERMKMAEEAEYKLIVTIVNKGDSEMVLNASKDAGARGGTILFGRGTGVHEHAKLFGISIEPEKELILTLIEKEKTSQALNNIVREAKLDKPGHGITFVIDVETVAGIAELDEIRRLKESR